MASPSRHETPPLRSTNQTHAHAHANDRDSVGASGGGGAAGSGVFGGGVTRSSTENGRASSSISDPNSSNRAKAEGGRSMGIFNLDDDATISIPLQQGPHQFALEQDSWRQQQQQPQQRGTVPSSPAKHHPLRPSSSNGEASSPRTPSRPTYPSPSRAGMRGMKHRGTNATSRPGPSQPSRRGGDAPKSRGAPRQKHTLGDYHTAKVLQMMLPNRKWRAYGGGGGPGVAPPRGNELDASAAQHFEQTISLQQSDRDDLRSLNKALDNRMRSLQARPVAGTCRVRELLFSQLFDEMIRQGEL